MYTRAPALRVALASWDEPASVAALASFVCKFDPVLGVEGTLPRYSGDGGQLRLSSRTIEGMWWSVKTGGGWWSNEGERTRLAPLGDGWVMCGLGREEAG